MNLKDLKNIRRSLGVSQLKLAKLVGVSMLSIRLWENGAATPNETNREALERVIGQLQDAEAQTELSRPTE